MYIFIYAYLQYTYIYNIISYECSYLISMYLYVCICLFM